MLFVPWRNEDELMEADVIARAAGLRHLILENSKPYYFDRMVDENLLNELAEDLEEQMFQEEDAEIAEQEVIREEGDDEIYENEQNIAGPSAAQFLPPRHIPNEDYQSLMRSLNERQRRIVLDTLHRLKTNDEPIYTFISGGAGVGKSHAIFAIVQSYMKYFDSFATNTPGKACVIVTAPTGKAAFNVFGMTLHTAFKLPPNQSPGHAEQLSDAEINTLRMQLEAVWLFIIDEVSMVSVRHFYDINSRLQQIFNSTKPFGGRSVIVVGDLRQLPPIPPVWVFENPSHLNNGTSIGNYLWKLFSLWELTEIMRQKGDYEFCKALNNMAEGCMDEDDVALIRSREISSANEPPMEAIRLFKFNEDCTRFNNEIHAKLQTEGVQAVAYDRIQGKIMSL